MTDDELNELRQFHAEIEEYERNNPLDSPRQLAVDAEDVRLAERFPGEYVSYLDAWDGTTLTRTILAHAADWREYRDLMTAYPDAVLEEADGTYVHPPNVSLCNPVLTNEYAVRPDAPRE